MALVQKERFMSDIIFGASRDGQNDKLTPGLMLASNLLDLGLLDLVKAGA
jgi:hypothetical protein